MKTREFLSIIALSLLGLCFLSGLVKMVMKKESRKKPYDQGCAASVFIAVVLLGISQLLTEREKYTGTPKYKSSPSPSPYIPPLEVLTVITQSLDRDGITYWLDYGTLLGAHREGEIMEHDNDVDIAYLTPNQDQILEILRRVLPSGFTAKPSGAYSENINIQGPFAKDMPSGLDLYGYKDKGKFLQIEHYGKPIPKEWVFPLSEGKLGNLPFHIPANTKEYLELIYGDILKSADYDFKTHLYTQGNKINQRADETHKSKGDPNYSMGIPKKYLRLLEEIAPEWWAKCVTHDEWGSYMDGKKC